MSRTSLAKRAKWRARDALRSRLSLAIDALLKAEAALADIGDAEREPTDDLKWCEERAAKVIPFVRTTLAKLRAP